MRSLVLRQRNILCIAILLAISPALTPVQCNQSYTLVLEPVVTVEEKIRRVFKDEPDKAVAIAMCESGLNPDALNNNPETGDYSVGVFQVNIRGNLAKDRPSEEWLKDVDNNIAYAHKMYKSEGWRPWSCSRKIG